MAVAAGLKYSSQCSPGRRTDTPWQLEARERHARCSHIFYPTEKPSSLVLSVPLFPLRSLNLLSLLCSSHRARPRCHALVSGRVAACELVASVPFSNQTQFNPLYNRAARFSLSPAAEEPCTPPSRIYVSRMKEGEVTGTSKL